VRTSGIPISFSASTHCTHVSEKEREGSEGETIECDKDDEGVRERRRAPVGTRWELEALKPCRSVPVM